MPRRKKNFIVRIRFNENRTMLFGNSYKPWEMQLDEYLFLLKRRGELEDFLEVSVSDSEWIGWGGLKWCPEENFQHQLNREGCQSDEPDNPNPRQYKDMVFYRNSSITNKVNQKFENFKANRY